jgi:pantoate--beta-alanine ligase
MKILRTISELRTWRDGLTASNPKHQLGVVATMGALHTGHLSLIKQAKSQCDTVIATIFVNPAQFGPSEDLAKYPRPIEADIAKLEAVSTDALFLPSNNELYPSGYSTWVSEDFVSTPLCGSFRPGHFKGVTTIVLKLFNLIQPTHAYFGQKDAQQCAVLEKMALDLNLPIRLIRGETVRESDGLAMSSRNVYLSTDERKIAPEINRALLLVTAAFNQGERNPRALLEIGINHLKKFSALKVQYFEIRDASTLEDLGAKNSLSAQYKNGLVAAAVYLGQTRLIDNVLLK